MVMVVRDLGMGFEMECEILVEAEVQVEVGEEKSREVEHFAVGSEEK